MKHIEVVAAVIVRHGAYFATQRGYGEFKGFWEFPGGKVEPGESPEQALRREIREELSAEIRVGELLTTVEWDYPDFHLTLHAFRCTLTAGDPVLREHSAAEWLVPERLDSVGWLPADLQIVKLLKQ